MDEKNTMPDFKLKDTDELLAMLNNQDHAIYSDEMLDTVRQILLERGVVLPPEYIPLADDGQAQPWEPTAIHKKRRIYLVLLLCMIGANVAFMVMGYKAASTVGVLLNIGFLYFFLRVARQVLSYSILRCILIVVITFIPFIGIIVLAIIDRKVYDTLKKTG